MYKWGHRWARRLGVLLAAMAISGCSTGVAKLPGVNAPPAAARPAAPAPGAFREAPVQSAAGLEGVIGARAAALTRRFGQARIDLTEGDARKLQFMGASCVLDIFLYPPEAGARPVATYVEARNRSDGADTDRARCIREVERER